MNQTEGIIEGYLSECEKRVRTLEWQLREATEANERLRAEREHLIEAASQIQSRLTVCQTHEAGWRERAEQAEAELARVRDVAWQQGNRADEAEDELKRLRTKIGRAPMQ